MKLPTAVKDELLTLYSDLRDARENFNEAVKAVAEKYNKKPGVVRKRIKLEAEQEKQPDHFAKAIAELVNCCKVLAEENEAAVLAEREACAKVCLETGIKHPQQTGQEACAAAIRARGMK